MEHEPDEPGLGADRRVMVVGAGLMGSQIGCEYALAGCAVTWVIRERARGEARIEQALALALHHRLASPQQIFPLLSNADRGSGFAPLVPSDPKLLQALRERRDAALAAELRVEHELVG